MPVAVSDTPSYSFCCEITRKRAHFSLRVDLSNHRPKGIIYVCVSNCAAWLAWTLDRLKCCDQIQHCLHIFTFMRYIQSLIALFPTDSTLCLNNIVWHILFALLLVMYCMCRGNHGSASGWQHWASSINRLKFTIIGMVDFTKRTRLISSNRTINSS